MVVAVGARTFTGALDMTAEVYRAAVRDAECLLSGRSTRVQEDLAAQMAED